MATYSIKDLEQLSGIKAHTLRIWEQRYNFINPKRTDTNIRYYDDNDLKLVLNISLLKDNGHKISKISKMQYKELRDEVVKITDKKLSYPEQIHELTLAMIECDEDRFEKILNTNFLQHGFEGTMLHILSPFLVKIGILWQTGTIAPSQEHFVSNLIRQKIIVALDGQAVFGTDFNKKFLLFLPDGEMHELTLLFSSYIIKSRKNKVIYLGQCMPLNEVESVYRQHKPDYLFTIMTCHPTKNEVQGYIDQLLQKFPESHLLITGRQVIGQEIIINNKVTIMNKLQDLIDFVEEKQDIEEEMISL
ncbi:MerR family transcriptional regulator [Bacteroidota bacterium]